MSDRNARPKKEDDDRSEPPALTDWPPSDHDAPSEAGEAQAALDLAGDALTFNRIAAHRR